MELLTRTFRTFRRILTPNGWFSFSLFLAMIALEFVGRKSTSDLHDALAVSLLALLGAFAYYRHRTTPLPWISRLRRVGNVVYNWAWSWTFDLGIDMRGSPPVKRGYPPAIIALGLFLTLWLTTLLAVGADLPQEFRATGVRFFYLGYLVLVALIWLLLVAGILLAFFIPMAMIHDAFVHAHQGTERRPRQPEMLALMLFFGGLAVAGWLVPVWALLAACAVALTINVATTTLPANSEVKFLWRPRNSIQVRAMPWSHWISCEFTLITLLLFDLVLTACGPRVLVGPLPRSPMPFTAMLGTGTGLARAGPARGHGLAIGPGPLARSGPPLSAAGPCGWRKPAQHSQEHSKGASGHLAGPCNSGRPHRTPAPSRLSWSRPINHKRSSSTPPGRCRSAWRT